MRTMKHRRLYSGGRTLALLLLFTGALLPFVGAHSNFYTPLKLPKATELAAFSNGLPPGIGKRRELTRDMIEDFLKNGKSNTNPETWKARRNDFNRNAPCDGVFTTQGGKVYFWTLVGEGELRIETASGEYAYLEVEAQGQAE